MSKLLNSENKERNLFSEQRERLAREWEALGLLDSYVGKKINIADLLMSEAAVLLNEEINRSELAGIARSIKVRTMDILNKYCS